MKERGITADVFVAKGTRAVDLADLARRARRSDAILVQKKLFSRWKLPLLLGSAPLLFDLDDAVFAVSPDERERFGEERAEARARSRRRRLAAVLKRSRKVIAGNPFLADYASRHARDVAVLPTGVDLRPFPEDAIGRARQARRGSAAPRIGWVGRKAQRSTIRGSAIATRLTTTVVRTSTRVSTCCPCFTGASRSIGIPRTPR